MLYKYTGVSSFRYQIVANGAPETTGVCLQLTLEVVHHAYHEHNYEGRSCKL